MKKRNKDGTFKPGTYVTCKWCGKRFWKLKNSKSECCCMRCSKKFNKNQNLRVG